jgi:hypothetical protein
MALITAPIPIQAFELIRNRIGEILIEELSNQVSVYSDQTLALNVYIERSVPLDKTELPAINVNFAGGPLDSKNIKDGSNSYAYNIDVYTSAKATDLQSGDEKSAIACQRIIGACRSIILNPVYKTLGFATGANAFISRVTAREISVLDPAAGKQDADSTHMERLVIIVSCTEIESLIIPSNIDGYDARVTIDNGSFGYKYTGNA